MSIIILIFVSLKGRNNRNIVGRVDSKGFILFFITYLHMSITTYIHIAKKVLSKNLPKTF